MKPDTKNPLYDKYVLDWQMISDVIAGERTIKGAGETYLPKLSGQSGEEYLAYVNRGSFFNATSRTLQGLVGAIIRKDAEIEAPEILQETLVDVTTANQSIHEVIRFTADNVLSYGFFGILVDRPKESPANLPPYMALYKCTDILNWYTERINGEDRLLMIALAEVEYQQDSEDPYILINKDIIRVCYIDKEDGYYKQKIFDKMEKPGANGDMWQERLEEIIPTKAGVFLEEIPFVFISADGTFPIPSKPPLLDVGNLNIKHWQVSTDYYHGLHYCAIPTPWAAGFRIEGALYIGSQKAWISEDPQAKCGFLEFSGAGLLSMEKALDKLEKLMAVMGARLLEEQKMGVEAAEAIKLRISGDTATLSAIVQSVEEGIGKALTFMAWWMGIDQEIIVRMSKDFVSQKLTPQDITALLQAVQAGRISMDTFLYNLQAGEILPPDRSIQDEKDLIKSEAPVDEFSTDFSGATGATGDRKITPIRK